jgi:hypothetical protein
MEKIKETKHFKRIRPQLGCIIVRPLTFFFGPPPFEFCGRRIGQMETLVGIGTPPPSPASERVPPLNQRRGNTLACG